MDLLTARKHAQIANEIVSGTEAMHSFREEMGRVETRIAQIEGGIEKHRQEAEKVPAPQDAGSETLLWVQSSYCRREPGWSGNFGGAGHWNPAVAK